jgi:hypothetical protein
MLLAVAAIFATAGLGVFVGGVVDFVHDHFVQSLPFVLFPLVWIAFAVFIIAPNKRQVQVMLENVSTLSQDVTKLLDATFTFLN